MSGTRHLPRRLTSLSAVAFVLAFTIGDANGQDPSGSRVAVKMKESYSEEVKVSGRVLVGAVVVQDERPAPGRQLALVVPTTGRTPVCVQAVSIDGRYFAEGTIAAAALPTLPGRVELEYQTQYDRKLRDLPPLQLAILAFAGDCTAVSETLPRVFAVYRSAPPGPLARVSLLINSERLDTAVRYSNRAKEAIYSRCQRIEDGRRTSFDTICVLSNLASSTSIAIERRRYERLLPDIKLQLVTGE